MRISNPNDALLQLLSPPYGLDATEIAALSALPCHELRVPRGGGLPADSNAIFIVLDGWLCGCKFLGDGKRQICSIHIAGDALDLPSLLSSSPILEYHAVTPCLLGSVTKAGLLAVCQEFPVLAMAIIREMARKAAIHLEWVTNIGSRRAINRVAHLMLELVCRLDAAGNADTDYYIPLTQTDLGDAVGISAVHVNRVLQELRYTNLLEIAGGHVKIPDRQRLAEFAGFDPKYLQLDESDDGLSPTFSPGSAHEDIRRAQIITSRR